MAALEKVAVAENAQPGDAARHGPAAQKVHERSRVGGHGPVRMPPVAQLIQLRQRVGAVVGIGRRPGVHLDDREVEREVAFVDHVDGAEERGDVRAHLADFLIGGRAGELGEQLLVRLDAHRRLLQTGGRREQRRVGRPGRGRQGGGHFLGAAGPGLSGGRRGERRVARSDHVGRARLVRSHERHAGGRADVGDDLSRLGADVRRRVLVALDFSGEMRDRGKRERGFTVPAGDRDPGIRRENLEPLEDERGPNARGDRKALDARLGARRPQGCERPGVELEAFLAGDRRGRGPERIGIRMDGARDRRRGRHERGGQGHEPDENRLDTSGHVYLLDRDNRSGPLPSPPCVARRKPRSGLSEA